MKKGIIVGSAVLAMLISGCSNSGETKSFTEMDDSELGSLAQAAKDQAVENQAADASSSEEEVEDTANYVVVNEGTDIEVSVRVPNILPEFTDIYDPASIYYHPEEFSSLPCISDYQAMDLSVYQYDDSYYDHWYAITDVYLTGKETNMNYYSQWGVDYYANNSASQQIFEKALEVDEPVTIIGYCTENVDGCAFYDCIIVDAEMYNIYNNIEMRNDGITSPPSDSEDYHEFQVNPDEPIENQIMDGFVGAMQDAADTPEEQEFAQAYGEAWEFVEALKKAGY